MDFVFCRFSDTYPLKFLPGLPVEDSFWVRDEDLTFAGLECAGECLEEVVGM